MAIDYKKEWDKFRGKHGLCRINVGGKQVHVKQIMENQIRNTINARENLMQEFVKKKLTTNISKQDEYSYCVDLVIDNGIFGSYYVSKNEFRTWLEKRKEVK